MFLAWRSHSRFQVKCCWRYRLTMLEIRFAVLPLLLPTFGLLVLKWEDRRALVGCEAQRLSFGESAGVALGPPTGLAQHPSNGPTAIAEGVGSGEGFDFTLRLAPALWPQQGPSRSGWLSRVRLGLPDAAQGLQLWAALNGARHRLAWI